MICVVERQDLTRHGASLFDKDSLAGAVQVTARQFLSPLSGMSSDSLTMPWPAAAAEPVSRVAPRRAGDPGRLERMPGTDNYRDPVVVSAGCIPQAMMLPRIRSCQTKRCRAAAMPPHSNPHHLRPSQNHMKVKTR